MVGQYWIPSLIVLCLLPVQLKSVTISEPSTQTIYKAAGETVQLGCTYTLDPAETGTLDIEWTVMNPDSTALDKIILTYMDNNVVSKGPPELMKRVAFTAGNPNNGDASITISYLEAKDSGTYGCKVKKYPGLASRKVTLIVQVPPSNPRCLIEGDQTQGKDVTLMCRAEGASTPLSFSWEKTSGAANPTTPALNMAGVTGDLLIKNLSQAYAGTYQCSVGNTVGVGRCSVELTVSSSNRAAIIAGAVIGAILLLLLLLLLIWCLICCCNKRRYEKELANDIREDVGAPPSNTNSRVSSVRTAAGYRPHHISYSLRRVYSAAHKEEPKPPSQTSSELIKPKFESYTPSPEPLIVLPEYGRNTPSPQPLVVLPESTRHTPYNIQRVGGVAVMVPAQTREGFVV
ncbi:coxsackievirus and adenovirus receptor homolog [Pelobates cultripes]|uniref:Coxsackievirus and adenovirus receptor homolog n=1 Tax=Pelobates cultripes TaxID=61616 RepID=A0AAD1TH43_PELCU|nr:coxsackievirus and adenovirus receptor homolog [Pelobates cultripes]